MNMVSKLNLLSMMRDAGLTLTLVQMGEQDAEKAARELIEMNLKIHGSQHLQVEMVRNPAFIRVTKLLIDEGADIKALDALAGQAQRNSDSLASYPIEAIRATVNAAFSDVKASYYFLKHYTHDHLDEDQRQCAVECLKGLTAAHEQQVLERVDVVDLLTEPFFLKMISSYHRRMNWIRVCELLVANPPLQAFLRYRSKALIQFLMTLPNLEQLASSDADVAMLDSTLLCIGQDEDTQKGFLREWIRNGATLYDLQTIARKIQANPSLAECGFMNRSSYINLICGGAISGIPLETLREKQEELLLYALSHKKRAFLRLVSEDFALFDSIPTNSILFDPMFYGSAININALNRKNLRTLSSMTTSYRFDALANPPYTFDEVAALYTQPNDYQLLYNQLRVDGVDKKLMTIRQLIKHKALPQLLCHAQLDELGAQLTIKPLSAWISSEFSHIGGIDYLHAAMLLSVYGAASRFVPELTDNVEIEMIQRNAEHLASMDTIGDLIASVISVDESWLQLNKALQLSDEFISEHSKQIIHFVCRGGADIANRYYEDCCRESQREAVRRIVKAEIMGTFKSLKYHEGDLQREIELSVSHSEALCWQNSLEVSDDDLTVRECDDFYSTMTIGTAPQRTCLSYIDGQYKDCLLSIFDSNKKILYAWRNGQLIGRAIIRFTKGMFSKSQRDNPDTSLTFVDVERDDPTAESRTERLTLFLERSYIAYADSEKAQQVKRLFVSLAEKKAAELGCLLAISGAYSDVVAHTKTKLTWFGVFISKSKGGAQYLDSLDGEARMCDEGSYKYASFYVGDYA